MAKIKRGEPGHNAGKTIKKNNPKSVVAYENIAKDDKSKQVSNTTTKPVKKP